MWSKDRLYFDEFSGRVMVVNSAPREWRDDDDVSLTCYMQDTTGMTRLQKNLVCDAVDLVARRRGRHAVREYLQPLEWDEVPRIYHALEDHWGVECDESQPTDYVRAASGNLFVGLVARVLRPGCKLDTMIVFEGAQGIHKSSALDVLGGAFYAAIDESAATKDFLQATRGKWVVEIAEMNAVTRSEHAHVKGMLSRRIDTYRPSYGRRSVDVPRQCVFAGTTNRDDWHTDDTGGRRFWPIRCGQITPDTLSAIRDQLFAEAVYRLDHGATWWEMPGSSAQVQSDRFAEHAWTSLVLDGIALQSETTMHEILTRILKFDTDQITHQSQLTVGSILRHAGWIGKPTRRNGRIGRVWFSPSQPQIFD